MSTRIDPYGAFQDFERWFLGLATRPTVTAMVAIFALLALVTLLGRPWTRSVRAWFWFSVVNVAVWLYFHEGRRVTAEDWQVHIRFFLVWGILISGGWLAVMLYGKYVRGWEDR